MSDFMALSLAAEGFFQTNNDFSAPTMLELVADEVLDVALHDDAPIELEVVSG